MPYYRIYHFNRSNDHINRADEIEATDDVQAVAIARNSDRETAVEVWQEGRKVLRLEGPANISAPLAGRAAQQASA